MHVHYLFIIYINMSIKNCIPIKMLCSDDGIGLLLLLTTSRSKCEIKNNRHIKWKTDLISLAFFTAALWLLKQNDQVLLMKDSSPYLKWHWPHPDSIDVEV